jgi:hypothetical protein
MEYANFLEDNTDLTSFLKKNVMDTDKEYDKTLDLNQYIGWNTITEWNSLPKKVFTKKTLNVIEKKVYEYLLKKLNKKIVPSERVIVTALYGVYKNHIPRTGDIYGKYLVVDDTQRDDYSYIVDKTISLLASSISTDIEMQESNSKLNIWNATVLGDFNENGLQQFSNGTIKLRNRGPDRMLFHMKY